MPAINQQVASLAEVGLPPGFKPDLLVIDADDSAFPFGVAETYPDYPDFIDSIQPGLIALITANPNAALARERKASCGADVVRYPRVANLDKRGLVDSALDELRLADPATALVVGNRWLTDVVIPRHQLFRRGIDNRGVRIDREDAKHSAIDRHVLRPIDKLGAGLLAVARVDHFIRPRV